MSRFATSKLQLKPDGLVFIITVSAFIGMQLYAPVEMLQLVPSNPAFAGIGVMMIAAYIAVDMFAGSDRLQFILKRALALLAIGFLSIAPAVLGIVFRPDDEPERYTDFTFLQAENAVRFVLDGKNPYVQNYTGTSMADWPFRRVEERPWGTTRAYPGAEASLHHFDQLPGAFLLPLPLVAAAEDVDLRWLYLAFFALTLWLASRFADSVTSQQTLLLAVGLNPLLVLSLTSGRNDIVLVLWVMLAAILLSRKRLMWAFVAVGAACATSFAGWLLAPFAVLYASDGKPFTQFARQDWKTFMPGAVIFLLAVLPWVLWSPSAFFTDTVAYPLGFSIPAFTATGYGFSEFIKLAVNGDFAVVALLLQVLFVLPVLVYMLRVQKSDNSIIRAMIGFSMTLLVASFFSHHLLREQLGIIFVLMLAAAFMDGTPLTAWLDGDKTAEPAMPGLSQDGFFATLVIGAFVAFQAIDLPVKIAPSDSAMTALIILLLGLYWVADLFLTESNAKTGRYARRIVSVLFLLTVIIGPSIKAMIRRVEYGVATHAHDGMLQNELAVDFVLDGKNPYVQDYTDTPMKDWPFFITDVNPALYHYVYLPLTFLIQLPFQAASNALFGWYDQRVLLLVFYAGFLWILTRLTGDFSDQQSLLLIVGLNPVLFTYLIDGRNDALALFWIGLTVLLVKQGRTLWSAVTIAIASGIKQLAWFVVPFWFVVIGGKGTLKERLMRVWKPALLSLVIFLAALLPYFLASPDAFIDDILRYPAGKGPTGYPINGIGLSVILYVVGVIPSITSQVSFTPYQLAAALPLFAYLVYRLWNHSTFKQALLALGIWLLVYGYLNRFFNTNYLGVILTFMYMASFMGEPGEQVSAD